MEHSEIHLAYPDSNLFSESLALTYIPCSGYMAPEYAGHGTFFIKSDVYSFGVIVLEVVFGEKNRTFVYKEHCNNLIGHVSSVSLTLKLPINCMKV